MWIMYYGRWVWIGAYYCRVLLCLVLVGWSWQRQNFWQRNRSCQRDLQRDIIAKYLGSWNCIGEWILDFTNQIDTIIIN
jgi:hypothetical protein